MDTAVHQPVRRSPWRDQLVMFATDWFLLGMMVTVVVASIVPSLGMSGGALRLDVASNWGVVAIFFLHGIGLSTEKLKQGLSRWPLHVVVQAFTFLVFPIIGMALSVTARGWLPRDLLVGFIYLCVLPSTVSSSVAMTAAARGNVAAAVFNATVSTLIGVFLTPIWVSVLVGVSGDTASLGGLIINLAGLLLLPFAVGQALRPVLGAWFARYRPWTSLVDRGVILLLVWNAFSDSVANGLWRDHSWGLIGTTLVLSAAILAFVLWLSRLTARRLAFDTEDEIATVFCGSKKTLASGVPMARIIFGGHPALGVIVLPLMFYHQLQLLACAVLAQRYAQRPAA